MGGEDFPQPSSTYWGCISEEPRPVAATKDQDAVIIKPYMCLITSVRKLETKFAALNVIVKKPEFRCWFPTLPFPESL